MQKDWGKGNTILGGMFTSTHRSISDPSLALLPTGTSGETTDGPRWLRGRINEASGPSPCG